MIYSSYTHCRVCIVVLVTSTSTPAYRTVQGSWSLKSTRNWSGLNFDPIIISTSVLSRAALKCLDGAICELKIESVQRSQCRPSK